MPADQNTDSQNEAEQVNSGSIQLPETLAQFADEVVIQMKYLHPETELWKSGRSIGYRSPLESREIEAEISYGLLRAKIRHEGATQRQALFRSVFGQ